MEEASNAPEVASDTPATTEEPIQHIPPAEKSLLLQASNLELKTLRGKVYENVNLNLAEGEVLGICGYNGSGKTALLLTLAGRMNFTQGTLRIAGYELPHGRRRVQRMVGLGLFKGLNDLQESLTVTFALKAEFDLFGRKTSPEALTAYLTRWDLLESAQVRIKDLTAKKLTLLGIALAFAGNPRLVVIDNIEDELTKSQSEEVMQSIIRAARTYTCAVAVGCLEKDLAAMADCVCYLEGKGE